METQTLTWIHLSDLHMEANDLFNRKVVLASLWQDIGAFIEKGIKPDFIVFSGDVTYHGTAREYELAIKEFFDPLLAITKITKDRIFIVPGNHDANWARTNMLRNPISQLNSEDDIRKLLDNLDERDLLLSPFSNYKSFINSYLDPYQQIDDPRFAFCHTFEKGEISISIIGLNSAWLSGFHKDADGKIQDFGKLAIGEIQVRNITPTTSHLKIGIVHHPFDWLIEMDRNVVEDLMAQTYSFVLRGHLHRPDVIETSSLSGNLLNIPTGSVFDSRLSPNTYNIVQLDLEKGDGIIYLRRFNARRTEWQKDIESTGEERNGQVTFKIPKFWIAATVFAGDLEPSTNLRDYVCVFTEECKRDALILGLSEDTIINLVQGEFRSHLNYFRFDIEDYPLPVKTNHIIYLDKNGQRIDFKRVISCTKNEAKLASWNDILALYRRATRLAYREEPQRLLFVKGMIRRVADLHLDMKTRIEKHYKEFDRIEVHPGIRQVTKWQQSGVVSEKQLEEDKPGKSSNKDNEIAFHLLQSESACQEVYNIIESLDNGDITDNTAISLIVTAFERSLQHIHKIILRYPPIED